MMDSISIMLNPRSMHVKSIHDKQVEEPMVSNETFEVTPFFQETIKHVAIEGMEMGFSNGEQSKICSVPGLTASVVSCDSVDYSVEDADDESLSVPLDFRKEYPLDMDMEFIECLQANNELRDADGELAVSASMDWEADSLYFRSENESCTVGEKTETTNLLRVDQSIPRSHGEAATSDSVPDCDGEGALQRWVDAELVS
uniref:Uncharacterized protein n=1 Tax=Ditylum brightwellii TaxID=49249 RepID=A0A6U3PQ74_9STRA|mmetsp:Transcript_15523/g.23080  ORF Transcript_15523/g.23080 Transcript_15523/m.23080 type:complete len:200 (+) Transcript_15523:102-701(+)|eukprot:15365144-Ditylum_brightwellii.AAC.1